MKVLAIDPGYERLGVAVLKREGSQDYLLYSDCLRSSSKDELPDRLYSLATDLEKVFQDFSPDILAIETLFFNKNQKTAMGVAHIRGIIFYLAKLYKCKVVEYGPQEIKVAMTGYGNSDKSAVIAMVKRLVVNAPESALDDEYDAIAVGVTALAHQR